ncbi:hypothetical protein TIN4_59 [Tsukamurella phage TIN4]|uniref:Uncharacterized protein n=2 Tax=Tinduovirus TIN3 TaxID=1982571 RepID=A0A0K0N5H8_9CAUD|nr:hypothetical protein AVT54_gp066 [Tsukamurella phage TIN3]YP_009604189.1 hypothetical protein FDH87_gp066 [Tsukamurella phage TIN4]AKJ71856.1 hypothetical protein TIN3_59 [Tsukamurella phage TIN3]AKJ71965.1 hypothetical protein TIN4_59 [Tsukamurella phage TIN4]
MEGNWSSQHLREFLNEVPPQEPGETYREWCERVDKLEKKAAIRKVERDNKRDKARKKRRKTGR